MKRLIGAAVAALLLATTFGTTGIVDAAPESAAAPSHSYATNPAWDICTWLRAVWFPGWYIWDASNISFYGDPIVQCIYFRGSGSDTEWACTWWRRRHPHETVRIANPYTCINLVS